ncbi:hypothetical protein evm_006083 [Chilo suppressalis]|nr:hypothetical protein evm_006083 [Chilo suppressalis]
MTARYSIEVFACSYFGIALTLQGYVNSIVDCTIVAFYGQCELQLKLLRYNLEHLTDLDDVDLQEGTINENTLSYIDDNLIKKRLVHCVKHHQKIIWFLSETQSISNEFVTLQLSVACWTICMSVYKLVTVDMFSGEFFLTIGYLNCMLMQFFMYCYHGSQVLVESEFIAESAYCSNWVDISPRSRRLLLIFMVCCTRPLVICAAKIVPINLESYLAVLKASYTLFTILHKK